MDNMISVERNVPPAKLEVLWVEHWPTWSKEESEFEWTYEEKEMCYILSGEATVTPHGEGEAVTFKRGDLIIFPKGMSCTWKITKAINKHYKLGD